MALVINTDNKWRHLLYGSELPKEQRKEFSYLTDKEYKNEAFMRYRNRYYNSDWFEVAPEALQEKGWEGYNANTAHSGLVAKIDGDKYMIGTYYVKE